MIRSGRGKVFRKREPVGTTGLEMARQIMLPGHGHPAIVELLLVRIQRRQREPEEDVRLHPLQHLRKQHQLAHILPADPPHRIQQVRSVRPHAEGPLQRRPGRVARWSLGQRRNRIGQKMQPVFRNTQRPQRALIAVIQCGIVHLISLRIQPVRQPLGSQCRTQVTVVARAKVLCEVMHLQQQGVATFGQLRQRAWQRSILPQGVIVDVQDRLAGSETGTVECLLQRGRQRPGIGPVVLVVGKQIDRQIRDVNVRQLTVDVIRPACFLTVKQDRDPQALARRTRLIQREQMIGDHPRHAAGIQVVVQNGDVHGADSFASRPAMNSARTDASK